MSKRIESQRKKIKKWLEEGKSITPMEALRMWDCFRLGGQIFALIHDYGMDIVSELIFKEGGKRYARYSLRKESLDEQEL